MAKNYYAILGILPNATSDDIRSAYKRRAKELHPDHYGENSSPFLEVQEAYGVLSDPGHRSNYDRSIRKLADAPSNIAEIESLRPRKPRPEPLRSSGKPVDFGGISLQSSFRTSGSPIEEIFDRVRGNFSPTPLYKAERLQNLNLEIVLTPEEARRGGQMQIMVPAQTLCPTCAGQGAVGLYQCYRCMGNGNVSGDMPVVIEFAPGISDGYQKAISLRHFGIRDVYISITFRISRAADIEEL